MSESVLINKIPLSVQSTQQALAMLRNMREKRKKQNPASIYDSVKFIYAFFKQRQNQGKNDNKKKIVTEAISAQQYLGNNRQSIEDMLLYIKSKLNQVDNQSANVKLYMEKYKKQSQLVHELQVSLTKKQSQIIALNQTLKFSDQKSKQLQIKLLNNIKKLTTQIQQKDTKLNQLHKILSDKEIEIQQITFLNEKQHKKIRKLQEDVYDLQMELQQKIQELKAESECADFLEKKIGKMFEAHPQTVINSRLMEQLQQFEDLSESKYQK